MNTLISNNTTIKFSGTQAAASSTSTNANLYTVPSGKTLVGSWAIDNNSGTTSISIGGTAIAVLQSNGTSVAGPLYANSGSVISCSVSVTGSASIHGVLMENTP